MAERVERPVHVLPVESAARKGLPVTTGVLDYFAAAIAEVARVSKVGNDKHNPGQPLHWSRGKSNDHADAIGRHLLERGTIDPDTGLRHSAQLAWRALAFLQQELEDAGAPLSRGSSFVGNLGSHIADLIAPKIALGSKLVERGQFVNVEPDGNVRFEPR